MSEQKWIETHGKKPANFEATDWAWVRWDNGNIGLSETWGGFEWSEMTHYMPAPEIREPAPPSI